MSEQCPKCGAEPRRDAVVGAVTIARWLCGSQRDEDGFVWSNQCYEAATAARAALLAATNITAHEGKKYLRTIRSAVDPSQSVEVDIYAVLVAFGVTCPARQHAVKKLLCCGNRGKGDELDDLRGASGSVSRAIELATPPVHLDAEAADDNIG